MVQKRHLLGVLAGTLVGAGVVTAAGAHSGPLATGAVHSCVAGGSGQSGGALRIVGATEACRSNETPLDWTASMSVQYRSAQDVGMARAFCNPGEKLTGGGGLVEPGAGNIPAQLRQSHPISDQTGVIAHDNIAIGWQAASSDFTYNVTAFAICA